MKIKVAEITGEYALTADRGTQLYDRILPLLQSVQQVELDFNGVKVFGVAFWNYAIGQLLRDFSPDTLNRLVKVSELNEWQRSVLGRVIDNAKEFYGDGGLA